MWMSIALRNILYKIRVKRVDTEKIGIKTCEDTEREPRAWDVYDILSFRVFGFRDCHVDVNRTAEHPL